MAMATLPQVRENDNLIPSENGADLLNRLFRLGPEHSKKLSDTERIFSEIGVFQVIITKIVPDHFNHV